MWSRTRRAVVCLAAVVSCALSALGQGTPVLDLTVMNGTSQPRVQEPTSFGIPLPAQPATFSMAGIGVLDPSLHSVPCQFKVLTRWGGTRTDATKPIRWVLVSFLADAPANGNATYHLAIGTPQPTSGLWAQQDAQTIQVHTGPSTWFTIRRNAFTLFDSAIVDGVTMASPGHMDFVGGAGDFPQVQVTSTELEEYAGWPSVRAVVKQTGIVAQLRFTCRWFFYWGRSDVAFEFRLENRAAYGLFDQNVADGQQYFDRIYLVQPIGPAAGMTVASESLVQPLAVGQLYDLRQRFVTPTNNLDLYTGFQFTEGIDGVQMASGSRSCGAVDLANSSAGATVTIDRFWQQFPKAIRARDGAVEVGIFPEWGNGPEYKGPYENPSSPTLPDPMSLTNYRFEGGRWKTHRVVFDFHGGGPRSQANVAAASARANAPLFGMPNGSWVRRSGATGTLFMEHRNWTDPGFQRFDRMSMMLVDDNQADLTGQERIGLKKFLRRGGTYGGNQTFGWDHYGDIWWADGFCSQHYDWTASILYAFWRTGDYRFYDFGRDMAASRRDYNQNHSTNPAETWRGAQFYEKGWWHGNATTGRDTHNWVEGLLVHYAMTGDEGTREAAVENLGYIIRAAAPKNWSGHWGSRGPGWSIDSLVSASNYLGDPVYLNEARLGIQRYEQIEVGGGANGYVINPANGLTASWGEAIFYIAACKYYLNSGDPTYLPLLGRMRNWFKTAVTSLPSGPLTAMTLPSVHDQWSPTNPGGTSIHLAWPFVESFAYTYVISQDPIDLLWGQMFFDTLTRYPQGYPTMGPQNVLNPGTWSSITCRPYQYPSSESKVIGNALRWGNAYQAARVAYEGGW